MKGEADTIDIVMRRVLGEMEEKRFTQAKFEKIPLKYLIILNKIFKKLLFFILFYSLLPSIFLNFI